MENNGLKFTTLEIADKVLYQQTGLKFCKDEDCVITLDWGGDNYALNMLEDKEGNRALYYTSVDDFTLRLSYKVGEGENERFVVDDYSNELRLANISMYGKEYKHKLLSYIDKRDNAVLEEMEKEQTALSQQIADLNLKLRMLKEDKKAKTLESIDEYAFWSGIELEEENIKVE